MRLILATGSYPAYADEAVNAGPILTKIEYNAVPTNSMQLSGQGVLLLLASPHKP